MLSGKLNERSSRPARNGAKGRGTAFNQPFMVTISDAQYRRLSDLVYRLAGIHLGQGKKELMRARILKRMRAVGCREITDYIDYLAKDQDGAELVAFLDTITTNLTNFFREPAHFDYLAGRVLPDLSNLCGLRGEFRLWSAACSTGEEPFTLAMVLLENQDQWRNRKASILASDLSTKVLKSAAQSIYPASRVKGMERAMMERYFHKGVDKWEGHVRVRPEVRKLVTYKRINLIEQFKFQKLFHVIFCRNVMIYFDQNTRTRLVEKFSRCLTPGGYLFVGHSESLSGMRHSLEFVLPAVYRKPG